MTLNDVGPGSTWEVGLPWMTLDLEDILHRKILTPALQLTLKEGEQKEFEEGLVIERTPDILTQGHYCSEAVSSKRVDLVSSRAKFSDYLILPTKYPFSKVVRILSLVMKFVENTKEKIRMHNDAIDCLPRKRTIKFQVFSTLTSGQSNSDTYSNCNSNNFEELPVMLPLTCQLGALCSYYVQGKRLNLRLTEENIQDALHYLYVKATLEVEKFCKADYVAKLAVKKDGLLYHKSRILEGQRFLQTGGFEELDVLKSQGINIWCPVIDRWSPLAYSIGEHIHTVVQKHGGMETCYRASHSFVHIIKGYSLFQELGEDCTQCKRINKRFVEAAFGPVHPSKFSIAPPFWASQCDIWGPIGVFVPGREKNTRNSSALSCKVYALVFVCLVTKLTNIQIIETKDVPGICDGLTRLSCEVGTPARLLIDQDSAIMKILREGDIEIIDLETYAKKKCQIDFAVCPVSGHNFHGLANAYRRWVRGNKAN